MTGRPKSYQISWLRLYISSLKPIITLNSRQIQSHHDFPERQTFTLQEPHVFQCHP